MKIIRKKIKLNLKIPIILSLSFADPIFKKI